MATRFRGISQIAAASILAATLLAMAALIYVAVGGAPSPTGASFSGQGDQETYARIVDRMRQGEGYYAAAHEELLHGGFGTRSVFNWRLPALPWLTSRLPSLDWAAWLLRIAALAGGLTAFRLIDRRVDRSAALILVLALATNLVETAASGAVLFADVVAGVLVLISASAYGLRLTAVGFIAAVLALFARELAAPYVAVCVILAWRQRRRAELWAWLAALALFAAYFAWHYLAVQSQLGPNDVAYQEGWLQFGGANFVLATARFNGLLQLAPLWVTAILLPLCILGLIAWRDTAAQRIGLTVAVYIILFAFVGKPFDAYWGALYAPLLMFGVAFLPAAAIDLTKALRGADSRRAD